jgi:hypothetical protein
VRALASIQRNRSILRAAAQLPVERTVPLRHRAEESLIVVNANKVVYLCNHAAISPLAAFFHARLRAPAADRVLARNNPRLYGAPQKG